MTETRSRVRTVGAVVASFVIPLVVLSPTLLFGESLTALSLVLIGTIVVALGTSVRAEHGLNARPLGTAIVLIGALIFAIRVGVTAILLAGWST